MLSCKSIAFYLMICTISGSVSLPLMRLILKLLVSLSCTSVMVPGRKLITGGKISEIVCLQHQLLFDAVTQAMN